MNKDSAKTWLFRYVSDQYRLARTPPRTIFDKKSLKIGVYTRSIPKPVVLIDFPAQNRWGTLFSWPKRMKCSMLTQHACSHVTKKRCVPRPRTSDLKSGTCVNFIGFKSLGIDFLPTITYKSPSIMTSYFKSKNLEICHSDGTKMAKSGTCVNFIGFKPLEIDFSSTITC